MQASRFLLMCFMFLATFSTTGPELWKVSCENAHVQLRCNEDSRSCCEVGEAQIQEGGPGCASQVTNTLKLHKLKRCGSPPDTPVVTMLSPAEAEVGHGGHVTLGARVSPWPLTSCTWTHASATAPCANGTLSPHVRVSAVERSTQAREGSSLTRQRSVELALHLSHVTSQDAGLYTLSACNVTTCATARYNVTVTDSPNQTTIIVGAIVGTIVGIAIIALVIYCIGGLRKLAAANREKRNASDADDSTDVEMTDLVAEDK